LSAGEEQNYTSHNNGAVNLSRDIWYDYECRLTIVSSSATSTLAGEFIVPGPTTELIISRIDNDDPANFPTNGLKPYVKNVSGGAVNKQVTVACEIREKVSGTVFLSYSNSGATIFADLAAGEERNYTSHNNGGATFTSGVAYEYECRVTDAAAGTAVAYGDEFVAP
jgi:hypothetical protein